MSLFSKKEGVGNGVPGFREELTYCNDKGTAALRTYVESTIISRNPTQVDRIVKYQLYWYFYNGQHWRQYNDTFLKFNYVKAFIDKINTFTVGNKGFSITVESDDNSVVEEELEKNVEGVLELQWRKNKKVQKLYETLQMGAVCGDVWLHCQWNTDGKYVQIDCLDSRQCFPEFADGDTSRVEGFVLRQPLETNDNKYLLKVTRYTKEKINIWYQRNTSAAEDAVKINEKEFDNPYGFIPIVHIKNRATSDSYWGPSDARDIFAINKTYNEEAQSMKNIIDYYSAPTTIITGGTIKSLTRGMGKIWSGLPAEANVFNLGLGEDLNGMINFLALLKTAMHELSDVPENALGRLQAISNTSAAALQVTYQPLIQQADQKAITYSDGIADVHDMVIRILRIFDASKLKGIPKDFSDNYTAKPVFTYGLPQDRMIDLQQGEMELRMGITSKRNLMNRLGVKNVTSLQKEIDGEKISDSKIDGQVNKNAGLLGDANNPFDVNDKEPAKEPVVK